MEEVIICIFRLKIIVRKYISLTNLSIVLKNVKIIINLWQTFEVVYLEIEENATLKIPLYFCIVKFSFFVLFTYYIFSNLLTILIEFYEIDLIAIWLNFLFKIKLLRHQEKLLRDEVLLMLKWLLNDVVHLVQSLLIKVLKFDEIVLDSLVILFCIIRLW